MANIDIQQAKGVGVQGTPWDWYNPTHRALADILLDLLRQVHSLGVLHGDLADEHILVTQDQQVFLLDFGNAAFLADPHLMAGELRDWHLLLNHGKVRVG